MSSGAAQEHGKGHRYACWIGRSPQQRCASRIGLSMHRSVAFEMAGFAVVMTILTYGIIGILGAGALSVVFSLFTRKKLRNDGRNGRSLLVKSTIAPLLRLAWPIVVLGIESLRSPSIHNDNGPQTEQTKASTPARNVSHYDTIWVCQPRIIQSPEHFIYADSTSRAAAELMATQGLSVLPVKDRATGRISGEITLLGL